MKILVVSNLYPPQFIGGYEIACADTVELLESDGHDCYVVTSSFSKKPSVDTCSEEKISRSLLLHSSWNTNNPCHPEKTTYQVNFQLISDVIRSFQPDFIYIWNIFGLTVAPVEAARASNVPCSVHVMDFSLFAYRSGFLKKIWFGLKGSGKEFRNLHKLLPHVIYISEFVKRGMALPAEHSSAVIYPFLKDVNNLPRKFTYTINKDNIQLVYLGQMEEHKGIHIVCQAISELMRNSNLKFKLNVYAPKLTDYGLSLIDTYADFLCVQIGVERETILRTLKDYDIGVFPSVWEEPFGIAQIEILASGLPLVSSGRGGSAEALDDRNCLRYQFDNSHSLAQQIHKLIESYDSIGRDLGTEGADFARKKFSKTSYLSSLNSIFKSALNQRESANG